jgi:hypothetical protein
VRQLCIVLSQDVYLIAVIQIRTVVWSKIIKKTIGGEFIFQPFSKVATIGDVRHFTLNAPITLNDCVFRQGMSVRALAAVSR